MDPAKQRDISSQGGRAAHTKGKAHKWTLAEARLAGSKGGQATKRNRQQRANTKENR